MNNRITSTTRRTGQLGVLLLAAATPGVTQTSNKYTWDNALLACAAYSQAGTSAGQWRLPTIKELGLIYSKKSQLTGVGSFTTSNGYWSVTEYSSYSSYAWNVNFDAGYTYYIGKSNDKNYVRCVRDI
ncbi:DUF1566 domain-containing protein [Alistipes indistinctus]|nr:DUF1566 domain-containing protein [Alistipes indistinctus]